MLWVKKNPFERVDTVLIHVLDAGYVVFAYALSGLIPIALSALRWKISISSIILLVTDKTKLGITSNY